MSDLSRSKSRPLQRGACRRRIGTCADIVALATTPKMGVRAVGRPPFCHEIIVQKFIGVTFAEK